MSTEQGSGDLASRVTALEKANGHLKIWIVVLGVALLAGIGAIYMRVPSQVQAGELLIRDKQNQVRVAVTGSGVTLYDSEGRTRGRLFVSDDATGVAFMDIEGKNRSQLAISADGKGTFEVPNAATSSSARAAQ